MESPTTPLEVFSSILLQEYIRTMTAAQYLKNDDNLANVKFKITAENYAKMMAEPLQVALLDLTLEYDSTAEVLTVVPDQEFLEHYHNKIMSDVAQQFSEKYKDRYKNFITLIAETS